MDCERSNFKVLIVDHDEASLRYLTNVLKDEWQCIVKTAKDAQQALDTLQDNDGLCDLIITEFHLQGMNGFDFQKHIQDQFHLPIIMMSKDSSQDLISKTLENGAAHFVVKPFSAEDFKCIWKVIIEEKKLKLFRNRNNTDEHQGDGEYQVVKKPRLVWTTYLHNLFLRAIKQLGSENAKPKKIRDIMNIPNLTTANVASHLQKYHKFKQDVVDKGMDGGISNRALRSKFASDLPKPMVKEIKAMRALKHRKESEDLQALLDQMEYDKNVICFDGGATSNSSYRSHNAINLNFGGFGLDVRGNNTSEFQFASNNEGNASENIEFHQQKLKNNVMENEQNYNVGTSINEAEFNKRKFNLSNFLMADDMNNLNEMNANNDAIDFQAASNNEGNAYENIEFNQQKLQNNVMENEQNNNVGTSINEAEFNQRKFNLSNFLMADDMNNFDEMNANNDASESLNSYMFNFFQDVLPLEQLYKGYDDISPSAEITTCVWNESPKTSSQNSNQLYNGGNDVSPLAGITPSSNQISENLHGIDEIFSNGEASNRFMEDNMSKASTSTAIDPEFDMDLIEAMFGTIEEK